MAPKKLETLVGSSDIILVRPWHITIFTFLFSFLVLFVFFDVFQPTTLSSGSDNFVVPSTDTTGPYNVGSSASDKARSNKLLSDKGRIIFFSWAIGLGAAIGLLIHFLIVYYK